MKKPQKPTSLIEKAQMKTLFTFLFLTVLFIACQEKDLEDNCQTMGLNPVYSVEEFKWNYVVQFPRNYSGRGLHQDGLFQPKFDKFSPSGIHFYYYFPCGLDCHLYFGRELPTPLPEEVEYSARENPIYDETLDQRIDFCLDDDLHMVLYFSKTGFDRAKLFMKEEGAFKEALTIKLNGNRIYKVIEILETIKRKN